MDEYLFGLWIARPGSDVMHLIGPGDAAVKHHWRGHEVYNAMCSYGQFRFDRESDERLFVPDLEHAKRPCVHCLQNLRRRIDWCTEIREQAECLK